MGVLNITPDSFSDGGKYLDSSCAVEHALEMFEAGAAILDLGAESTRPGGGAYGTGAIDIPAQEQLRRLLPVLDVIRQQTDRFISIDTRSAEVAKRTLEHGADLINDVSGLTDPRLGEVVADANCPIVLMHSRGALPSMQQDIRFTDPLIEVQNELADTIDRAAHLGISPENIIVDPGIGFGKRVEQNLVLIGRLDQLRSLGRPILLGASRKSFIGDLTGAPPSDRLAGSLAAAGWAAHRGVEIIRVHDVSQTVQFLQVWMAISASREGASV